MDEFILRVKKLREEVEGLYIYGIGLYGQAMYRSLSKYEVKTDGFIVTVGNNEKRMFGLPVFEISDMIDKRIGLVLGLNKFNTIEVLEYLGQKKFDMERVLYRREFVRNAGEKCKLNENPMIEITTRIGCKVNCHYCPQSLLLSNYFKDNKERKFMMELDDFKLCLDKLPQNCDVIFCGMAEPLLNPH